MSDSGRSLWQSHPVSDKYLPAADGMRALCVFGVALYHVWLQSWLGPNFTVFGISVDIYAFVRTGYMFVDLMLMLSGFLMFLPYARAMLSGTALPDTREFYRRRFRRIVPSYLLCVLIMLFVFALPGGEYDGNPRLMIEDIFSHLTFTHTLFPSVYDSTRLNGTLWTLAVEVQFYILFPFVAKAFTKKPILTYLLMIAAAFGFRQWVSTLPVTTHFINQLPAMLDVYANGFLGALGYVFLARRRKTPRFWQNLLFTAASLLFAVLALHIMKLQNTASGYDAIRLGQMKHRYLYSLAGAGFLLCAGHSVLAYRFLLGNPVMRFFSAISYQAYIWHTVVALKLKEWRWPPYLAETNPNQAGELTWQVNYTWAVFLITVALSALLTYLFEKPVARRLGNLAQCRAQRKQSPPVPEK